jgi:hypothetical protein
MRVMRLLLFFSIASLVGFLRAEPPNDVLDLLRDAADALTNEDAKAFLGHFDRDMPSYAVLQGNIEGLMAAYDVESSIEVVSDDGDNQKRSLTLDWTLTTEQKADIRGDQATRRRVISCTVERRGRQWKFTSIEPLDFFKY